MTRTGLTGYYHVEAWRDHTCVWFSTTTQRRTVVARVERALADYRSDVVFVNYVAADQRTSTPVAQVTSGGIWRWQQDPKGLRAYVEADR